MNKARGDKAQPEQQVPVRVVGVHLGASKTTRGRKLAIEDFAGRLQATINELAAEGRVVSSELMTDQGAIVVGRLELPPPAVLAAMQHYQQQQMVMQEQAAPVPTPSSDEVGLEINEVSHRIVRCFLNMARQLPPMPPKNHDQHLAQLFETLIHGVTPNDLQVAADDCAKILAYRKRTQEREGTPGGVLPGQTPDDKLLSKVREMLAERARTSLH